MTVLITLCACKKIGENKGKEPIYYIGEIPKRHATFNPYTNLWRGPGSDRINKAWRNHVYLDTIKHKWKWSISEKEKEKLDKEDIKIVDSLLYGFNKY